MSASGAPRKGKGGKSSLSRVSNVLNGHADGEEGEVLFDDDIGSSVGVGGEVNTKEEERGLSNESQSHSRA